MKKSILAVGATALLAISLTACSSVASSNGPVESQPAVEPVTKSTPTQEPATDNSKKSARGNTIKAIGEPSFWKESSDVPDEKAQGKFTVTEIKDVVCDQPYASPPTNGKIIGLTVDVETYPSLAENPFPSVSLNPYSFKYIAPNGTTFNSDLASAATYSCIDNSLSLATSFGPAEKAHGMVLLDVPSSGGVLTIGSVEWNLP